MASHDPTVSFIITTQIKIFEDVRHDLQKTLPEIAAEAHLPDTTVNKWAQGVNALSLWGVKKLLRVKGMAPYLSRLFAPEEYALLGLASNVDYDEVSAHCRDFIDAKEKAHHPESEAGVAIGENEGKVLQLKASNLARAA